MGKKGWNEERWEEGEAARMGAFSISCGYFRMPSVRRDGPFFKGNELQAGDPEGAAKVGLTYGLALQTLPFNHDDRV